MATLTPAECSCRLQLLAMTASFMLISAAVAYEFRVGGGTRNWKKPTGDEPETYNHWASKNRFQIGDTLRFKYENDSVLVVDRTHYKRCDASDPLARFDDGGTTFRFDRHGIFFFISGQRGHCESGQRMMVRVMADRNASDRAPEQPNSDDDYASAPSPSVEPKSNAAFRIANSVGPLIMPALAGIAFLATVLSA